jgi:anti-sigma factor RsiW
MKCPIETRENTDLLAYCAGSLSAERRALLDEHIRDCHSCREFADGQKAVWEALDVWEAPPVSPGFDRRLYERIEQEVSWWDLLTRPFRPLLLRRGLPIAATAGLVLMAGLMIQNPGAVMQPVPPAESAQVEGIPPEQLEHAVDEMEMMREFNRLIHPDGTTDPKM